MKKLFQGLLFSVLISFSAWQIIACSTKGISLAGAAGAQETMIAQELSTTIEPPPKAVVDVAFYIKPTTNGGVITTSEATIPSMGRGAYEITFPGKIKIGNSENVQLIVALDPQKISRSNTIPYSQRNQDFEIIQDYIEIWSPIHAELNSGEAIDITSDGTPDKTILSSSPVAKWNWLITPNKSGKQTLILSINFLPGNAPPVQLAQKNLEIFVEELPPSTQTPVPIQTSTPIPTPASITATGLEMLKSLAPEAIKVLTAILAAIAGIVVKNKYAEHKEKQRQLARKLEGKKVGKDAMDTSKAKPANTDEDGKKTRIKRKNNIK